MNSNNAQQANNHSSKLYRSVWRWHFYAGIFCIPFIIILSVTGAIYLFKPQIDNFIETSLHQINSSKERSTPNQHIAVAIESVPGSSFLSYRLPQNINDAVLINVIQNKTRYLVYVDPYTLKVLKRVQHDRQFIQIVRSIHGELLAGNAGAVLVELAACWAIVLILTGVYLWWPRKFSGFAGVIYPRIRDGGRRVLKDLHAVIGVWVAGFTLLLLVSGLPWALVWGSAFKELRKLENPFVKQEWQTNNNKQAQNWRAVSASTYDLNQNIYLQAESLNFAFPVEVSIANEEKNHWKVSSQNQNRPLRQDAWINNEGEVYRQKSFADKKPIDKIIGVGIAIHEGQLFGWFNQLLGLLTALGLITMSVTGAIMWLKRKPADTLGAPPAIPDTKNRKILIAFILLPALFLPVLFISIVVIALLEKLVFQNIPYMRNWFCLAD